MRKKSMGLAALALVMVALAVRHPSADIRVLTHDAADQAPSRVQAAVDLGVMGVSLLVTWSKRLN
ncbi:MAG: hypothetical protein A4S12_05795 [Proteobacteria bacterium SG_bin5]|nr:hypothetical protein [Sphingomonas sp.]OQW43050.1 MAG: hypothetical protein A4S12_05795 [Proteobacteria bacterium SG_bin5]